MEEALPLNRRAMDSSEKLKCALQKVRNGIIEKGTVQLLRSVSDDDKSKWMSGLDRDGVLKISEVFRAFIVEKSALSSKETSKSTRLLEEVVQLLLETVSSQRMCANTALLRNSIQPICDYLERKLNGVSDKQKVEHEKSVMSIFRLLRECVSCGALNFEMIPTKFVESCIETGVLGGSHKELQKQCLLLIVAITKGDDACSVFKTKLLDCILKQMSDGRFRKTYAVGDKKVSAAAVAIAGLVQHRLLAASASSDEAFKHAFVWAAYVIEELCKKCEPCCRDSSIYFAFVNMLLDDLAVLNEDPMWPAARLLLRMLVKKLCRYLLDQSPAKLKVFAVKQLTKIALRQKARESAFKKTLAEIESCFGQIPVASVMDLLLTKYLEQTPGDPLCGDASRANKIITKTYEIDPRTTHSKLKLLIRENWTESEAAAAVYFTDKNSNGYSSFEKYVQFVLKAASGNCKTVKSAAAKSLGELILAEPTVLTWANVGSAMEDCLTCASATGREAIAKVLGRFLTAHPDALRQYGRCLRCLMDDTSLIVRRAAIEAVTSLFKKLGTFFGMNDSALKILSLIGDPEDAIQKAVCGFFTSVWLECEVHLECLLEIGRLPKVASWVRTVLMQIKTSKRARCQSQVPNVPVASNVSMEADEGRLVAFATSLTSHLRSETQPERRQVVSSLLETLAQVHPDALSHQVAVLIDVLFSVGECDNSLERSICNTLVQIVPYITVAEAMVINLNVHEILKRDTNFEMPTANLMALLKLLIAVSCDNSDQLRLRYIQPSLDLLRFYKKNGHCDDKKEIKRALCFVVYLWKDYTKDGETTSLITHYLKSPLYNLTVLSALCYARLEHVPSCKEPFLLKLIPKYLSERSDIPLTTTALYFVLCTLQGYQKTYQKPEMKQLGDSTTEVVSHLLQAVLTRVLECVVDHASEVRRAACPVVLCIIQSGLILMPRLLPHLVAMTTDPDIDVQRCALSQLASSAESWDISLTAVKGFRLAFELAKITNTQGAAVRGFDAKKKTSTCYRTLKLVESSPEKIRKLTESVIKEVENTNDFELALFLMDQIVYFPYVTVGEVRHVVQTLGNVLSMISSRNESLVAHLFRRGETFMMDAYKTAFRTITTDSPETWSKEPAHRSKSVEDYMSHRVLSVLSDGEKLGNAVRGLSSLDEDSDSEMDLPVSELREKEKMKRVKRKVCYEATAENVPLIAEDAFTFHDGLDVVVEEGVHEKPESQVLNCTQKEKRTTVETTVRNVPLIIEDSLTIHDDVDVVVKEGVGRKPQPQVLLRAEERTTRDCKKLANAAKGLSSLDEDSDSEMDLPVSVIRENETMKRMKRAVCCEAENVPLVAENIFSFHDDRDVVVKEGGGEKPQVLLTSERRTSHNGKKRKSSYCCEDGKTSKKQVSARHVTSNAATKDEPIKAKYRKLTVLGAGGKTSKKQGTSRSESQRHTTSKSAAEDEHIEIKCGKLSDCMTARNRTGNIHEGEEMRKSHQVLVGEPTMEPDKSGSNLGEISAPIHHEGETTSSFNPDLVAQVEQLMNPPDAGNRMDVDEIEEMRAEALHVESQQLGSHHILVAQEKQVTDAAFAGYRICVDQIEEIHMPPQIRAEPLNVESQKPGSHHILIPEKLPCEEVPFLDFGTENQVTVNGSDFAITKDKINQNKPKRDESRLMLPTPVADNPTMPADILATQKRDVGSFMPTQDESDPIPGTLLSEKESNGRASLCTSDDSFLLLSVPIKVEKSVWASSEFETEENQATSFRVRERRIANSTKEGASDDGRFTSMTPARVKQEKPDETDFRNDYSSLIPSALSSEDEVEENQASPLEGVGRGEANFAGSLANLFPARVKLERPDETVPASKDDSDLIPPALSAEDKVEENRGSSLQVNERGSLLEEENRGEANFARSLADLFPTRVKQERPDETVPASQDNLIPSALSAEDEVEGNQGSSVNERGALLEEVRGEANYAGSLDIIPAKVKLERPDETDPACQDDSDLIPPTLPRQEGGTHDCHLPPLNEIESGVRIKQETSDVQDRAGDQVNSVSNETRAMDNPRTMSSGAIQHDVSEGLNYNDSPIDLSQTSVKKMKLEKNETAGAFPHAASQGFNNHDTPIDLSLTSVKKMKLDWTNATQGYVNEENIAGAFPHAASQAFNNHDTPVDLSLTSVKEMKPDWDILTQDYSHIVPIRPSQEYQTILGGRSRDDTGGSLICSTSSNGVSEQPRWSPLSPPENNRNVFSEPVKKSDDTALKVPVGVEPNWSPVDEDIFILDEAIHKTKESPSYITVPDDSDEEMPVAHVRPKLESPALFNVTDNSSYLVTPLPLIQLVGKSPYCPSTPKFPGDGRSPQTQIFHTAQTPDPLAPLPTSITDRRDTIKLERSDSGDPRPAQLAHGYVKKENLSPWCSDAELRNSGSEVKKRTALKETSRHPSLCENTIRAHKNPCTKTGGGDKDIYLFTEDSDPPPVERTFRVKKECGGENSRSSLRHFHERNSSGENAWARKDTTPKRKSTDPQGPDMLPNNKENISCRYRKLDVVLEKHNDEPQASPTKKKVRFSV